MKQRKTVNAIAHRIFGETPDEDEYEYGNEEESSRRSKQTHYPDL